MLTLKRICAFPDPIPESRVRIDEDNWLWVQRTYRSPRAADLHLSGPNMPSLVRRLALHESLVFSGATIKLVRINNTKCILSFDAPRTLAILREELLGK